jgi:hypothetical protein
MSNRENIEAIENENENIEPLQNLFKLMVHTFDSISKRVLTPFMPGDHERMKKEERENEIVRELIEEGEKIANDVAKQSKLNALERRKNIEQGRKRKEVLGNRKRKLQGQAILDKKEEERRQKVFELELQMIEKDNEDFQLELEKLKDNSKKQSKRWTLAQAERTELFHQYEQFLSSMLSPIPKEHSDDSTDDYASGSPVKKRRKLNFVSSTPEREIIVGEVENQSKCESKREIIVGEVENQNRCESKREIIVGEVENQNKCESKREIIVGEVEKENTSDCEKEIGENGIYQPIIVDVSSESENESETDQIKKIKKRMEALMGKSTREVLNEQHQQQQQQEQEKQKTEQQCSAVTSSDKPQSKNEELVVENEEEEEEEEHNTTWEVSYFSVTIIFSCRLYIIFLHILCLSIPILILSVKTTFHR